MAVDIQGKKVFITGASAGIGEACAKVFAKAGCHVILSARREEKLVSLVESLSQEYNTKVDYCTLDVSNKKMVTEKLQHFSDIDILINNAGLALGLDTIGDANMDDWDKMIDTNIKGLAYVTQQVIPKMKKRNHGDIVNVSSISGHRVYAGGSVYCATKHAVDAFTRALKIECHGQNIRILTIEPGMVETEFSIVRFAQDKNRADKVYEKVKALSGEDVADTILFAVTRPRHVAINRLLVMPNDQIGMD